MDCVDVLDDDQGSWVLPTKQAKWQENGCEATDPLSLPMSSIPRPTCLGLGEAKTFAASYRQRNKDREWIQKVALRTGQNAIAAWAGSWPGPPLQIKATLNQSGEAT